MSLRSFSRKMFAPSGNESLTFFVYENTKSVTSFVVKEDLTTNQKDRGASRTYRLSEYDQAVDDAKAAVQAAASSGWKQTRPAARHSRPAPPQPQTPAQPHQQQPQQQPYQQQPRVPQAAPPKWTRHPSAASVYGSPYPYPNAHRPVAAPEPPPPPQSDVFRNMIFGSVDEAADAIIKAGFLALAKVHHPDVAGHTVEEKEKATLLMSLITEARNQLKQMMDLIKG